MPYRIYPPIGIARVGNDLSAFYVGPEIPGGVGVEIDAQGAEAPVQHYKVDEDQIKRQAARFRLFEVPAGGGEPAPAQLPAGATVEWTVHLVNKKAAVQRAGGPPEQPQRPQLVANPASLMIDPGPRSIAGSNSAAVKFDTGSFKGRTVPLGELRTDRAQNLLVFGGFGFSSSPTNSPLPTFYDNPGWHDDVSDGPVTARIRLADGSVVADIAPAWVVVAPPDYAPEIQGVVTLYDILAEVGGVVSPAQVSFTRDVFPLLFRARRLRWVQEDQNWEAISEDWAALNNAGAAAAQLRRDNANRVRKIRSILSRYRLTARQNDVLDQWQAGNFQPDWTGFPAPATAITAEGLTRASLQSAVGQGFYPGIEAGVLVRDATLFSAPFEFRIDHTQARAGDLTALMALPWQADFYDCARSWWPSQRPDDVRVQASSPARLGWDRNVTGRAGMVSNFPKLAFITAQRDPQGNVMFAEDQRAPSALFV